MSAFSLACSLGEKTPHHPPYNQKLLDLIYKYNPNINHTDKFLRIKDEIDLKNASIPGPLFARKTLLKKNLSIEEQFYILFPVIALIIYKLFRKYFLWIIISISIISFSLKCFKTPKNSLSLSPSSYSV